MPHIRNSQTEKLILITCLGILESIKKNTISINEAEMLLFSPKTMKILKEYKIKKEIIDLIHLATELDDIKNLIPGQFSVELMKIIDKTNTLLSQTEEMIYIGHNWIDIFFESKTS